MTAQVQQPDVPCARCGHHRRHGPEGFGHYYLPRVTPAQLRRQFSKLRKLVLRARYHWDAMDEPNRSPLLADELNEDLVHRVPELFGQLLATLDELDEPDGDPS